MAYDSGQEITGFAPASVRYLLNFVFAFRLIAFGRLRNIYEYGQNIHQELHLSLIIKAVSEKHTG